MEWDKVSLGLLRRCVSARVAGVSNDLVAAFVNGGIDFYTGGRHVGRQDVFEVRSVFPLLSQEFLQSPQGPHSSSVIEACRLQS